MQIDRAALIALLNEIGCEGHAQSIASLRFAERLLEAVFAEPDIKDRLYLRQHAGIEIEEERAR